MKINPTTQKISNFFNLPNEQFFVPPYQRRYAWGISQLNALFNDINLLKDGDTHLLGMVVLLADTHSTFNRLELVDGQQRITTLCILLKVLRDSFDPKKNPDEVMEINKYLNCRQGDNKTMKIILGDLDHNDFTKIMNGKENVELENNELKQAVDFFRDKFKELGSESLKFYRKLTEQTELIRLDIGQAKDAYKLFETINNRGLKLSAGDIIKNFLLGHASMLGDDMLEDVKEDWRRLIINLDRLEHADMDKFFRHYLMGKLKVKIPKSKLIEEFKNYYYLNVQEAKELSDYEARLELIGKNKFQPKGKQKSEEDDNDNEEGEIAGFGKETYEQKKISIKLFVKELTKCSGIYKSLVLGDNEDPRIARRLKSLKRIESQPSYTFLISLFFEEIDDKERMKILDLIETFILRRQICEFRTSELDDIFPHLCRLPKKDLAENVKNEFSEFLPNDREFKEKFLTIRHRGGAEERAKHILSRIEYYLEGNAEEMDIRGGVEVHLEHIIPQTIAGKKAKEENGGDWVNYLGGSPSKVMETHKKYVSRIGNLSLLAQRLNIKASNNPFKAKIEAYEESSLKLNENIRRNYKNFKFPQVDERSKELATIALKIWKF